MVRLLTLVHQTKPPMIDTDTFLTALYVTADDFCNDYDDTASRDRRTHQPVAHDANPGRPPALAPSELLTLALFGQMSHFQSERDFYRYAKRHLQSAFPTMPERSQFNRALRGAHALVVRFQQYLLTELAPESAPYEALDGTAVPVRNAKRRGLGHLAGQADIGFSRRLGWYEGFHLLIATTPEGVVTGYGFGPASVSEQPLTDTFLALRSDSVLAEEADLGCVGRPASGPYVCDKGFQGEAWYRRWRSQFGAEVITAPKRSARVRRWPKALKRWLASRRQIVETAIGALQRWCGLGEDRPHTLAGFRARLAAKVALFNYSIWFNRQLGRADLAFADLIDW